MARPYWYDPLGAFKGVPVSKDISGSLVIGLALIAICVVPFLPILAAGAFTYLFAESKGWHQLFCILAGLMPIVVGLVLLISSRIFRVAYFGSETLFAAYYAFAYIKEISDTTWAVFAALIALAVGSFLTLASA